MKKKLFLALLALIVLILAAAGLVAYKMNDIVAGLRPQIEQQLSQALGATVELGEISASVFPTAHLSVKEAKVLTPGAQSTAISLGGLTASVALRPLLSKRLEIANLEIERPKLTLIKDASGTRVDGLSSRQPPRQAAAPSSSGGASQSPPSSPSIDITLSRISITDGEVLWDDKTTSTRTPIRAINLDAAVAVQGKEIQIPNLGLSFSAGKLPPLKFSGKAISFAQDSGKLSVGAFDANSDIGTIHADGSLDVATTTGTFTVSSTGIELKKIAAFLTSTAPNLAAMNLSGSITPKLVVSLQGSGQPTIKGPLTLREINADLPGPQRLRGLSGEISLNGTPADLAVSASSLTFSLQNTPLILATSARITDATIAVQSLSLKGLGGEIRLPLSLQRTGNQAFSAQPALSTIAITELLTIVQPALAQAITGNIVASKGTFSGALTGDVARSINGSGDIYIKDAVLKGTNIPNLILTKVSGIPLLEGSLRANIAPEHQKYFNDPDTKMRELKSDFSIAGGVINLRTLSATSEAFSIESSGTMSMGGELNLASTFTLSAEISQSLAKRSKTVQSMLSPSKQLAIPVIIKGKSPAIVVLPDISKLLQGAGGKILEEKAGALLEKALGGKKGPDGQKKKNPLGGLLGF